MPSPLYLSVQVDIFEDTTIISNLSVSNSLIKNATGRLSHRHPLDFWDYGRAKYSCPLLRNCWYEHFGRDHKGK